MLRQGVSAKDVVVDLTAGTTTMSVAAFMAAQERRIDCQYIHSEFDRVKNERIKGSEKAILLTSYDHSTNFASGEAAPRVE
jgi:hypothetical protein